LKLSSLCKYSTFEFVTYFNKIHGTVCWNFKPLLNLDQLQQIWQPLSYIAINHLETTLNPLTYHSKPPTLTCFQKFD